MAVAFNTGFGDQLIITDRTLTYMAHVLYGDKIFYFKMDCVVIPPEANMAFERFCNRMI